MLPRPRPNQLDSIRQAFIMHRNHREPRIRRSGRNVELHGRFTRLRSFEPDKDMTLLSRRNLQNSAAVYIFC